MASSNLLKYRIAVVCLFTAACLVLSGAGLIGSVRLEPQRRVLSYFNAALAQLTIPIPAPAEGAASGPRRKKCVLTLVSGIKKRRSVQPEDLSVFVQSWQRFSPETNIALFVDKRDLPRAQSGPLQALLSPAFGVELIPYESPPGRVDKAAKFHRYTIFLEYLEKSTCEGAVLSDARDVMLQANPWEDPATVRLLEENKVAFSVGGNTSLPAHNISMSKWNKVALEMCYGKRISQNKSVLMGKASCSGVTLGSTDAVKGYLRAFIAAAAIAKEGCVNDQAVHNYILHYVPTIQQMEYKWEVLDNNESPAFTYKWGLSARIDQFKRVVTLNGRLPPILHQYDRNPNLLTAYRCMYPISGCRDFGASNFPPSTR